MVHDSSKLEIVQRRALFSEAAQRVSAATGIRLRNLAMCVTLDFEPGVTQIPGTLACDLMHRNRFDLFLHQR